MDFQTLVQRIPYVIKAGFPIMIRGRHGIGKSEIVYQVSKNYLKLPVIEKRASQMTEGDLLGLPDKEIYKETGVTVWLPPDWYARACVEPVVLYLDELDRATIEVRQGIFELADSRKINGHVLHEGTVVVASINGGKNASYYQVAELDFAEEDRWWVVDVEPSVAEWLSWMRENSDIPKILNKFLLTHNKFIETPLQNIKIGEIHATRRSWYRLGKTMNSMDTKEYQNQDLMFDLSCGFIGIEGAAQFSKFIIEYKEVVSIKDLFKDAKWDLIEDWSYNDYLEFLEKIKDEKWFLKKRYSKNELTNLTYFLKKLPKEIFMIYLQTIIICSIEMVEEKDEKAEDIVHTLAHKLNMFDNNNIRNYTCEVFKMAHEENKEKEVVE